MGSEGRAECANVESRLCSKRQGKAKKFRMYISIRSIGREAAPKSNHSQSFQSNSLVQQEVSCISLLLGPSSNLLEIQLYQRHLHLQLEQPRHQQRQP